MGTFGGNAGNEMLGLWGREDSATAALLPTASPPHLSLRKAAPQRAWQGTRALVRRVTRLGPEEGGWPEPVGLGAEGDPAQMCPVPRRLAGPEASPQVPAVPAGAPSV